MNDQQDMKDQVEKLNHVNQLILDSVAEGIYGINLEAKVIFWNKSAEWLTGYTMEDFEQHNLHELIHHTNPRGEHVPVHQCPVYHALNGGESMFVKDDIFWRKDGTSFPVEYTVKPMIEKGEHVGSVITFRDMTEAHQTTAMMLEWEKVSLVGNMAAGIAHEIRNPLTSLKGFLKLIQSKPEAVAQYAPIMDSEFDRIEAIIHELLMFSKPQISQYQHHDLKELLEQIILLMEPQALIRNIHIVTNMESAMVDGIDHQLKQAFLNLIKNAIESMDQGGTIEISLQRRVKEAYIQIKDQGCGIPREILGKLGEPFFSTKETGTGLGLMVTFNIIENNHHGSITIESTPMHGSSFTITLPVVDH